MKAEKILRPDSKGRITLGKLAKGITGYKAIINEKTKEITLQPYSEIPYSEQWLFDNKTVFESVKRGLKQSSARQKSYKGSFSKFTEED